MARRWQTVYRGGGYRCVLSRTGPGRECEVEVLHPDNRTVTVLYRPTPTAAKRLIRNLTRPRVDGAALYAQAQTLDPWPT